MAKWLSTPCSHSSSTTFFSSFHNESLCCSRKLIALRSICHFSKWVPKIFARIQLRSHFELRSSNGYPLNAVSLQDGSAANPQAEETHFSELGQGDSTLSITVVGASGDLAKKKIFPALFALYYEDWLPENFVVFGYSRTKMNDEELRNMISRTLTCRIDKRENCDEKMAEFLKRCFYHSGQYNSEEHFSELNCKLKAKEVLTAFSDSVVSPHAQTLSF